MSSMAALTDKVAAMADGELIVYNNSTLSDTAERDAAVQEIRRRGLSRNGFYTAEAQQAAGEWVRSC